MGDRRSAQRQDAAPIDDSRAVVRLLSTPRRQPLTLAERSAISHLQASDEVPLAVLVSTVARDLYRDALHHGGWAAEIGDVSRGLFVSDAAHAVREADGILWAIG